MAAAFTDVLSTERLKKEEAGNSLLPITCKRGAVRKRNVALHVYKQQINQFSPSLSLLNTHATYILTHVVAEKQFNVFWCTENIPHTHTDTIFEVSQWALVLRCY